MDVPAFPPCLPSLTLPPMSSVEPQPPSSPELTPTALPPPKRSQKTIRRTARMSTGGRPTKSSLIQRKVDHQQQLDFPTRERLAREGRAYVIFLNARLTHPDQFFVVKFFAECVFFVVLYGLTSWEQLKNTSVCRFPPYLDHF